MVSGDRRLHGEKYRHEAYNLEKRFPNDARMGLVNVVLSQCLGDEEHKCVKNAGEVLAVVDEVIAALTARDPIFDENDRLVLPCRACGKGFLQRVVDPAGDGLQMVVALQKNRVPIREFPVDVLQCDVCTNTLHFAPGQPYEILSRGRKSRVDPQPGRPSVLRW